jgi:hypothetical protein
MSLEKCSSCGFVFLTEADPYIVRPTKDGVKLYCSCYIVGHNQFDHVDKIKDFEAKNAKLEKKLKESKEGYEAVAAWYIESLKQLMDSQKKLKIAVEAFNKIDKSNDCMKYFNNDIHEIIYETREALAAIKET